MRFVPALDARDAIALDGFRRLDGPALSARLNHLASVGDPLPYALIGLALALLALVRGRALVALAIIVLLAVTGATTHELKLRLGQGTLQAGVFPSGHATAVMTLACCAVLAVPSRARMAAAIGGAGLAAAVSYAIVSLGWHSPTDVLGGFLVAATWTGAAVTLLLLAADRRGTLPAARGRHADAALVVFAAMAAAVVAGGLAGKHAGWLALSAQTHSTAAASAAAIAALALALLAAFASIAP